MSPIADNTELDPGTGGDVIATDDVSGVKYQRVKLTDGTADSSTVIASGGGTQTNALRVTVASDSTGVLSVDDNGGSLTVDGPLTDTELRASAIDVDGSGVTQPVSAASLPLPTGAATAAKQPALGTAGSASTDVISIQGIASMTAVKVDGSGVTQPVSGTVTANLGTAAVTNAGTFAVQDSQVVTDNAAFTDGTTKVQPAGFILDETAGTALTENDAAAARVDSKRAQVLVLEDATTRGRRATVSAGGALLVDASATTQPVSGTVTANAGTGTLGTKILPQTSGGLTALQNLDVDETEDAVKASAGQLFGWYIYNDGAAEVYVKFYNATTANVTVGSTTPLITLGIPAGSAANVFNDIGIAFDTAITIAATTGATVADTGAPATNQVVATVFYA